MSVTREHFFPCEDTLELIAEGFMSFDSVNTCYDCWDKIQRLEDDLSESFSDADEGLLINYEG